MKLFRNYFAFVYSNLVAFTFALNIQSIAELPLQPLGDNLFFEPSFDWITKWRDETLKSVLPNQARVVIAFIVRKGKDDDESLFVIETPENDPKKGALRFLVVRKKGVTTTSTAVENIYAITFGQEIEARLHQVECNAQDHRTNLDDNEEVFVFWRPILRGRFFSWVPLNVAVSVNPTKDESVTKWLGKLRLLK